MRGFVLDDMIFEDVAKAILAARVTVPDQLAVVTHANRGSGMRLPFFAGPGLHAVKLPQ